MPEIRPAGPTPLRSAERPRRARRARCESGAFRRVACMAWVLFAMTGSSGCALRFDPETLPPYDTGAADGFDAMVDVAADTADTNADALAIDSADARGDTGTDGSTDTVGDSADGGRDVTSDT